MQEQLAELERRRKLLFVATHMPMQLQLERHRWARSRSSALLSSAKRQALERQAQLRLEADIASFVNTSINVL